MTTLQERLRSTQTALGNEAAAELDRLQARVAELEVDADWGEPVAYTTKAQIAAMQNGYQRNITAVDAKFAEAFGAKAPLYARNKP